MKSALAERRLPAHRSASNIVTWRNGDRRQVSIGLTHSEWCKLNDLAKQREVACGPFAAQIIREWLAMRD